MREEDNRPNNNSSRKRKGFMIFGAVVVVGLITLFAFRWYAKTHLKTDDAFVKGAIHLISSRVPGNVETVLVRNNQQVDAGTMLLSLEKDVYVHKLEEADASYRTEARRAEEFKILFEAQKVKITAAAANLHKAIATRKELEAMVSVREAEIISRAAAKSQAEIDLSRAENLIKKGVIPREKLDRAKTRHEAASASLEAAYRLKDQSAIALKAHESTIAQARAGLKVEKTMLRRSQASIETQGEVVRRRKAQSDLARLNLSFTEIRSPVPGFVTKRSVEAGNHVQPGQPLMTVVSLENAYIVANYKETKLGNIRPGQKVRIRIDALPGKKFTGKVDSIMAGTGAAFSLFPPENASGNYVKVVQRVPVKIVFDNLSEVHQYLRVGMSVVPTILVED